MSDSSRIKSNNRRCIQELTRSYHSKSCQSSSEPLQSSTVSIINNSSSQRPTRSLTQEILAHFEAKPSTGRHLKRHDNSQNKVLVGRHANTAQKERDLLARTHKLPRTRHSLRPTAVVEGTIKSSTVSNESLNGPMKSPDQKDMPIGRVSQLASHVGYLSLQDKGDVILDVKQQVNTSEPVEDRLPEFVTKSSEVTFPWYRYHRPQAPHPMSPLDINQSRLEVMTLDSLGIHCSEAALSDYTSDRIPRYLDQESTVDHTIVSSTQDLTNVDIPALEFDSDQENHSFDSDFPLPPPPITPEIVEPNESNDDEEPVQFYAPPDMNESLTHLQLDPSMTSVISSSSTSCNFGPLSPITNILPSASAINWIGPRQPKWLSTFTTNNLLIPADLHRSIHSSSNHSSSSSSLSFDSSPPPVLIECPPAVLHESLSSLDEQLSQDGNSTSNHLVRPIVWKRGAPDGAEQSVDEKTVSGKVEWTIPHVPVAPKRCSNCTADMVDLSPKKTRTKQLLPSEHSAFLPVVAHVTGKVDNL